MCSKNCNCLKVLWDRNVASILKFDALSRIDDYSRANIHLLTELKTVRQCALSRLPIADVGDQDQCSYWTGPPWVQPMSMAHCDLLDESEHC